MASQGEGEIGIKDSFKGEYLCGEVKWGWMGVKTIEGWPVRGGSGPTPHDKGELPRVSLIRPHSLFSRVGQGLD
jgi:hypothetical protein